MPFNSENMRFCQHFFIQKITGKLTKTPCEQYFLQTPSTFQGKVPYARYFLSNSELHKICRMSLNLQDFDTFFFTKLKVGPTFLELPYTWRHNNVLRVLCNAIVLKVQQRNRDSQKDTAPGIHFVKEKATASIISSAKTHNKKN